MFEMIWRAINAHQSPYQFHSSSLQVCIRIQVSIPLSLEVEGRKITLTTREMVRMLADRNARTVNIHSRLYRWKLSSLSASPILLSLSSIPSSQSRYLHCCLTTMLNMTQRGPGVRWWRDVPRGNAPTRKDQRLRSWQMTSCWRNEEEKTRSCGKYENTSCIVRKWSRKGKRRRRRKSRRRCWICDETPNLTFSTLLATVKKMVKSHQQQNYSGALDSPCTGGFF